MSGEGGPGPTARIQDPHMGSLHTYVRTYLHIHTYMHAYIHTYACTDRHMNVEAYIHLRVIIFKFPMKMK